MRVLLPLAVLALAGCEPPLEESFPARFYSFDLDDITYEARAQFDPFARGWFVRVTSIQRPLVEDDLGLALSIAETRVGPLVCDGDLMDVEPGEVWNPLAGEKVRFLAGPGTWQLVGRCTDRPAPPAVLAGSPWSELAPDVAVIVDDGG